MCIRCMILYVWFKYLIYNYLRIYYYCKMVLFMLRKR